MRCYIYVGGAIDAANITERPNQEDLVIAADSGFDTAVALGVTPSVMVGDFDSVKAKKIPDDVEIYRVPVKKDLTDTQLAVEIALSRGMRDLVMIGGLSGRLDHTLSNLGLLEHLEKQHVCAVMTDGVNRVRFIRNNSTLVPRGGFRYLSLIVADEVAKGVEVLGCKYPLKKATLRRTHQYAVSNELTGNCAMISVKRGGLFVIESKEDGYGKH